MKDDETAIEKEDVFNGKPWLNYYESHIPEKLDYPRSTLPDILKGKAQLYPDDTAIIFKNRRFSYQEYNEKVDRLAAGLQKTRG